MSEHNDDLYPFEFVIPASPEAVAMGLTDYFENSFNYLWGWVDFLAQDDSLIGVDAAGCIWVDKESTT
jgi:hypothetical protein